MYTPSYSSIYFPGYSTDSNTVVLRLNNNRSIYKKRISEFELLDK